MHAFPVRCCITPAAGIDGGKTRYLHGLGLVAPFAVDQERARPASLGWVAPFAVDQERARPASLGGSWYYHPRLGQMTDARTFYVIGALVLAGLLLMNKRG